MPLQEGISDRRLMSTFLNNVVVIMLFVGRVIDIMGKCMKRIEKIVKKD